MSDNAIEQQNNVMKEFDLNIKADEDVYIAGLSDLQWKESQEDYELYPPEIDELIQQYQENADEIKWYWDNLIGDDNDIKFLGNGLFWKVVMIWAELYPMRSLECFEKYKDREYAEEVLKKSVEKAVLITPFIALHYFEKYKDRDYAEEVLKKLVESNPLIALHNFEKYKDRDYAEEILKKSVENAVLIASRVALQYFDVYKDREYAEEILKKLVERDPQEVLKFFEKYKETSYASNIVDSIPLTEMLFSTQSEPLPKDILFESVQSLFEWLHSIREVKLWKKTLVLDLSKHLNIYSWLLKTYLASSSQYTNLDKTVDRGKVRKNYENNVIAFIKQGENRSEKKKKSINVFLVRAGNSAWDDKYSPLTYSNLSLRGLYRGKLSWVWKFHDYSSDVNPQSPEFILDAFEKEIQSHPKWYYLFHLWAHGHTDGSVWLKWWDRERKHFDRLLNIQTKYPNHIKVDLVSCNSWDKDRNFYDNTIKNLSMDSGKQSSYWLENWSDTTFLKAFDAKDSDWNLEADYDGDGVINFNEALLYRNIYYNYSLTPTMFDDGTGGRAIDISMSELEKRAVQAW